MPIDPVCGMEVAPENAAAKSVYKGKIYYFCSPMCKTEFEKDPDHYLTHGPKGMPGMEHGHGEMHGHSHSHSHDDEGCCCC